MIFNDDEEEVEETEEETSEETEESAEGEQQSGGIGGMLGGILGGAGVGGVAGGLMSQVGEQLKSGGGINIGELIDDATEEQGGLLKSAGDMIGGFLNKNKNNDAE
jgi:predicted lipid-binding transport protein (Tim44 family)